MTEDNTTTLDELIGDEISWEDPKSGEMKRGIVEDAGPGPYLWLEDDTGVPVDYIEGIELDE